jgi:hypothetical protein
MNMSADIEFIAYRLPGRNHAPIVPAKPGRDWMRDLVDQFANRCLPLLIANQSGWLLLNPQPLRATWTGGNGRAGVVVEYDGGVPEFPIANTMSWKFTRPGQQVFFGLHEPFCMVVPQRRGELESFMPRIRDIGEAPEIADEWREFERRRQLHAALRGLVAAKGGQAALSQIPWEREYMRGETPRGRTAPEHQKKLSLRQFQESDPSEDEQDGTREEQRGV